MAPPEVYKKLSKLPSLSELERGGGGQTNKLQCVFAFLSFCILVQSKVILQGTLRYRKKEVVIPWKSQLFIIAFDSRTISLIV